MNYRKMMAVLLSCALLGIGLAGCGSTKGGNAAADVENMAADGEIILNGTSVSAGAGVSVDGATATITAAGTYEISGALENGQLIVDTSDSVTLVLNHAEISCSYSAPLVIRDAENVRIEMAGGSVNTLSDGTDYSADVSGAEPDAAIFSKSDLIFSGVGSLYVNGNYNDAIASRDTLLIESGNISVSAVNHGIKGKDYLIIEGGSVSVQAGGDGLKSTNDTESALGYVEIKGGTVDITAADEGISAIHEVNISGGSITIATENNGIKSDGPITVSGGTVDIQTDDDGLTGSEENISAAAKVTVNGEAQ